MAKLNFTIKTSRIKGAFWRGVPEMYVGTSLEAGPNFYRATRYSIAGEFSALYFSDSFDLSKKEVAGKTDGEGERIMFIRYEIDAENIIDLTSPEIRKSLQVELDEIIMPRGEPGAYSSTQRIARIAYENWHGGILVPSVMTRHNKEGRNLVLYPARLLGHVIKEKETIRG